MIAGGNCLAALLAVLAGFSRFGPPVTHCPFVGGGHAHARAGQLASQEGYFAVLGSYWDVWPTVFHAWQMAAAQPIADRVFPTGYRSETLVPEVRAEGTRRLLRDGSIKMLCVGKNKRNTEFDHVDCTKVAEFNVAWGILPRIGTITETERGGDASLADVTIALPKVEIGGHLDFNAAARPDALLSGWHNPEVFGTWTDGTDARVAFVPSCDKPIDLVLELKMQNLDRCVCPRSQANECRCAMER